MRKFIAILGSVMVVALAAFAYQQYVRANRAMAEAQSSRMMFETERHANRALVRVRSGERASSGRNSAKLIQVPKTEVDLPRRAIASPVVAENDVESEDLVAPAAPSFNPVNPRQPQSSPGRVTLNDEEEIEEATQDRETRPGPDVFDEAPEPQRRRSRLAAGADVPDDEPLIRQLKDLHRRLKTVTEAAERLREAGEAESAATLNDKARDLQLTIREGEGLLQSRQEARERAAREEAKGRAKRRSSESAGDEHAGRGELQDVLREVRALRKDVAAIRKEMAELRGGMPGAQGDHHGGYIVMESITRDGKQIVVPRWVELGPPKRKAVPDDASPDDFERSKQPVPDPTEVEPARPVPTPGDQPTYKDPPAPTDVPRDDQNSEPAGPGPSTAPAEPTPDPADIPLLEKGPKPSWKTDPNSTAPAESSKTPAEPSPNVPATAPPAPTDRDPTTLDAHPGAPPLGSPTPTPDNSPPDPTKSAYDEAGSRLVLTKEHDKGQLVLLAPSRADVPGRKSKTLNWVLDSELTVDDVVKFLTETSRELGIDSKGSRMLIVVDDSYSQEEVAKFISAAGTSGFAPIKSAGIVSRLRVMLSQLPDGPRATVVEFLRMFDNGTEGLRQSIEFDGSTSLFGNFMSQRSSYYSHYGMDPKKVFVDLLVEENFSQEEYAKVLEAVKAAGFKKITRKVEAGTENPKLRQGSGLTVRIPAMGPDPVSFDSPFASPVPTEPNVAASTATDSPQAAVATSKWFAPESACRLVVQIDGTNANVSFQSPPREGNRQIRNSTSSGPELEIGGVSALLKASLDEWHVNAKETGILVVVDEEMSQEQLGKIIAAAGEFGPTRGGWLPQALKLMASQQVDEATKKVSTTVTLVSFQRNLEKGREGILETAEESGPIEDVGKILTKFVERYQGMEPDLKKSAVVTLQVDKSLPQHHVVQLVEAAQKSGFKSITIKAAEPETDALPKPEPSNVQY